MTALYRRPIMKAKGDTKMKKTLFTTITLILILLISLTACGRAETESIPSSTMNESQSATSKDTDPPKEEVNEETKKRIVSYLENHGHMPNFEKPEEIDQDWVICHFFTATEATEIDFDKYGHQHMSKISDIEQVAGKYVNPKIKISSNIDPAKYPGPFSPIRPKWEAELNGFVWSVFGGNAYSYKYTVTSAYKQNGAYYITCVGLEINWESEYESENGDLCIDGKKVGTIYRSLDSYDEATNTYDDQYTYFSDFDSLEKKLFVLRENGQDENGNPLFIIDSKVTAK